MLEKEKKLPQTYLHPHRAPSGGLALPVTAGMPSTKPLPTTRRSRQSSGQTAIIGPDPEPAGAECCTFLSLPLHHAYITAGLRDVSKLDRWRQRAWRGWSHLVSSGMYSGGPPENPAPPSTTPPPRTGLTIFFLIFNHGYYLPALELARSCFQLYLHSNQIPSPTRPWEWTVASCVESTKVSAAFHRTRKYTHYIGFLAVPSGISPSLASSRSACSQTL